MTEITLNDVHQVFADEHLTGRNLGDVDLTKLPARFVVICHFDDSRGPVPQNPAVHFQVTIPTGATSPAGDFLAFDSRDGDQIHGWMRRDRIIVDEVLRVWTKPEPVAT